MVFLIESSPANMDPRIGTDGRSERIDALLFDGLSRSLTNVVPAPSGSYEFLERAELVK